MSTLDEYLAQDRWRPWDAMLDRLPIEHGQRVLDLGCGPGSISARLAQRGAIPIGVDQDLNFLEAARRNSPKRCRFLQGNILTLDGLELPAAHGLWCSFAAAYFPNFAPVLKKWSDHVVQGGWIALIEVDDLLSGHSPLASDIRTELGEFECAMLSEGSYDFCMGRRLAKICESIGLTVKQDTQWSDPELAFDGPASTEIIDAWRRRFARMPAMKSYFGETRFHEIVRSFLAAIARDDHLSSATVRMVVAAKGPR